jgi:excisionase family DNA binding protein
MDNNKEINGMLTIREVAHILNVHINTVRRWSNQGVLNAYRIGSRGDRRFRQDYVVSFLSEKSEDRPRA